MIEAVPPDVATTRTCLRNARNAFIGRAIPFQDYMQHMPLCITTVGYNGNTCPQNSYGAPLQSNGHWQRLNDWYSCINVHNDGGTISQPGHSVVLWSGRIGKSRAELEAEQSRREVVRRYMVGNPAQWADTQIPSLRLAFGARARPPIDVDNMLGDLICLWLIFNADIARYPINMYGSIDFDRNGVRNPGTNDLLNAGVRKAIIVNAYFWKVEMLGILRLGNLLNVNPTVNVILKQYDANGNPVGNRPTIGWDPPRNIFGSQTSSIPVIVRPLPPNPGFRMYNIENTQNLRQLISNYNTNICNGQPAPFKPTSKRLQLPLNKREFADIVEFVDWTKTQLTTASQSVGPSTSGGGTSRSIGTSTTRRPQGTPRGTPRRTTPRPTSFFSRFTRRRPTPRPTPRPNGRSTRRPTPRSTPRPTSSRAAPRPTPRPIRGSTRRSTRRPTPRPVRGSTRRSTRRPTPRPTPRPVGRSTRRSTRRPTPRKTKKSRFFFWRAQAVANPVDDNNNNNIYEPKEDVMVIELSDFQIFLCLVLIVLIIMVISGYNCYYTFKQCKKNKKKIKYNPIKYDTETETDTDASDIKILQS